MKQIIGILVLFLLFSNTISAQTYGTNDTVDIVYLKEATVILPSQTYKINGFGSSFEEKLTPEENWSLYSGQKSEIRKKHHLRHIRLIPPALVNREVEFQIRQKMISGELATFAIPNVIQKKSSWWLLFSMLLGVTLSVIGFIFTPSASEKEEKVACQLKVVKKIISINRVQFSKILIILGLALANIHIFFWGVPYDTLTYIISIGLPAVAAASAWIKHNIKETESMNPHEN